MAYKISSFIIERLVKIIVIICSFLLTISLIIAREHPASGYESSIYQSTPIILWISLGLSILVGIIIIFYQIYNSINEKNQLWFYGLLLIFMSYIIILSLFIIRGYYMWDIIGDTATHLGYIQQIINTGEIPNSLFYPITHIYSAELSMTSNISMDILHKYIPILFEIIYVPSMYLLSKLLLKNKGPVIIATLLSCIFPISCYITFAPNILANLLLPLVIFIIFKYLMTRNNSWLLLSIIMIILYPVFHPIPAIAIGIILLTICLTQWYLFKSKTYTPIILLIFLTVWFIVWISSFKLWNGTIISIFNIIFGFDSGDSYINQVGGVMNYAGTYGFNIYEYIFKMYGISIIFLILTVSYIILYIKNIKNKSNWALNLYPSIYIFALLVLGLMIFNLPFGPTRFIFYIDMLSIIFISYLIFFLIKHINMKDKMLRFVSAVSIILILIAIFSNGILLVYPSPYLWSHSYQTTKSELDGMIWIINDKNIHTNVSTLYSTSQRFYDLLFIPNQVSKNNYITIQDLPLPRHFGYDNNTYISQSYMDNTYILITKRDKTIYTDVFPSMAKYRFNNNDYIHLNFDTTINKLYTNGEFESWYI